MTTQELITAIDKYFADRDRDPSDTRYGLEEAADHIAVLLDTLPESDL